VKNNKTNQHKAKIKTLGYKKTSKRIQKYIYLNKTKQNKINRRLKVQHSK